MQYTYDKGNLSSVQRTNNFKSQSYSFTYDNFGNMLTAAVGGRTLSTNTYLYGTGLLNQQTYGNGDVVSFTYDKLGRTKTATYDDGRVLTYVYNGEGRLHSLTETNGSSVTTYLYTYDSIGRLIYSEQKEGYTSVLRTSQNYNTNNQLTSQNWQLNGAAYSEGYTYNSTDGSLNTMTTGVGNTLTMGYDGLRRLTSVTGGPVSRQYTYRDIDSTKTTMQVASVTSGGQQFGYTYDSMGNIATYSAPGKASVTYTYDNQGQLLKAAGDTTYTYTYDGAGNILTANGHTYTYGDATWKDLLTAYDGNSITYDVIGNPTSYYNGTRWTMTWANGRSLATASKSGTSLSFAYDASGLRISKTVNGTTYRYYYASGKLMRMTWGSNTIDFFYDASGLPYAMKYNGTVYYYVTNLQGDVMRIVNASGTVMASYDYDPYGKVVSATGTLANVNPLRYRGYVYDQETGLCYVSSRYYDPEIGRFISADTTNVLTATPMGLTDKNLYAYCDNNPVVRVDRGGQFWETVFDVISLGASIVEVCINPTDPWAWAGLAGDAIDLIPFVTGVGEVTRAVKTVDKVSDTVQIAKAVDFTDDAADIVKTLDRSSGFTKSTASAGRKIHAGYKATDNFSSIGKEYRRINGIRPDYIDFNTRTIYELKPMNPRGVRSGIRQLQKYNKALGGGFNLRLELY